MERANAAIAVLPASQDDKLGAPSGVNYGTDRTCCGIFWAAVLLAMIAAPLQAQNFTLDFSKLAVGQGTFTFRGSLAALPSLPPCNPPLSTNPPASLQFATSAGPCNTFVPPPPYPPYSPLATWECVIPPDIAQATYTVEAFNNSQCNTQLDIVGTFSNGVSSSALFDLGPQSGVAGQVIIPPLPDFTTVCSTITVSPTTSCSYAEMEGSSAPVTALGISSYTVCISSVPLVYSEQTRSWDFVDPDLKWDCSDPYTAPPVQGGQPNLQANGCPDGYFNAFRQHNTTLISCS